MDRQGRAQLAQRIITLAGYEGKPIEALGKRQFSPADIEAGVIVDRLANDIARRFFREHEPLDAINDVEILDLRLALPDRDYIPTVAEALHDTIRSLVAHYLWSQVRWRPIPQDDPFYGEVEQPWT